MIIFSWNDLKRLLLSKQRKIVRFGLLCALLAFLIILCSPLQYEAKATFKQAPASSSKNLDLKKEKLIPANEVFKELGL